MLASRSRSRPRPPRRTRAHAHGRGEKNAACGGFGRRGQGPEKAKPPIARLAEDLSDKSPVRECGGQQVLTRRLARVQPRELPDAAEAVVERVRVHVQGARSAPAVQLMLEVALERLQQV